LITVNTLLGKKGDYKISEEKTEKQLAPLPIIGKQKTVDLPDKSITTYQPLILIVGFISGVSFLSQYPFGEFSWMLWMRHFMAGFFLVFSFFKLLNIKEFASSYAMYDLLAAKWKTWGYIYPFVELGLGVSYLIDFNPIVTNWLTAVVLGFSSLGVIKSNLDKRKIKCACLGDVFNLPMSTVTIVEDVTMVAMAVAMLSI
ncbi:MAG: heavy-metal-associated domain-containing protein, partial [Ekhidna sp.]|nr:heavy-metal-associated domain-containing protein [Ekhidna sp.]